ncbi:MAG: glycosyltransferase family 9 protein, partial [Chlamydiae bacterium]|nr:glycosyltransferase family 9 protein [Chlamydiota bacterium]
QNSLDHSLAAYDRLYIFYEKSVWMQSIIDHCMRRYPEKTVIINPIATKNKDYPYWANARFDGAKPFVENLEMFCREILNLEFFSKSNGIIATKNLKHRKYIKRIIIHPTSSRDGKNWPKEKYIQVMQKLLKKGLDPKIIVHGSEREEWKEYLEFCPEFTSLSELSAYVYESGVMIGNDSGIGHLASCLGIPTVTICRSKMASLFWRPSWSEGIVLYPSSIVPNIKGLRWRDKYWKSFVFVPQVLAAVNKLI